MKRAWWVRAGWLVRGCKDRGCHGQETLRAPHERICRDVLSLRSLPRVLARLLVYQPVRFRNYFYASPSKAAAVARGVYICARISRGSATSRRCISRRPASLSYAILRISRGDARGALLPLGSLPGLDLAFARRDTIFFRPYRAAVCSAMRHVSSFAVERRNSARMHAITPLTFVTWKWKRRLFLFRQSI